MNLLVNVTQDWGIGYENKLLVSISADLRRFRQLTAGKAVVLGRKTLETFPGGKPLKNRSNFILSARPGYAVEGATVVRSLTALREALRPYAPADICVIGGASVYEALLPYCRTAQITKTYVNTRADRFFPNLDLLDNWEIEKAYPIEEEKGVQFQYIDYVNKSPLDFL